jgi:hypothetical protein
LDFFELFFLIFFFFQFHFWVWDHFVYKILILFPTTI